MITIPASYRKQQAKQTKQLIFKTAIKLFQKYGFENVTVEDIIRAAEVSRGCFYIYYKNKEDLLGDYIHQNDEVYLAYNDDVLSVETANHVDVMTKIEHYIWFSVETLTAAGPHLLHLYNIYLVKTPEVYAKRDRYFFTILKKLYDEAKEADVITDRISYTSFQEILLWILRGITIDWASTGAPYPIENKRPLVTEFLSCIRKDPQEI